MTDQRFELIKERLERFSTAQLQEILDFKDLLLFDEFNYHEGKFCPLAIGIGAHYSSNPTQESVAREIAKCFNPVNVLKGVPGRFYHGTDEERRRDLMGLIREILMARSAAGSWS